MTGPEHYAEAERLLAVGTYEAGQRAQAHAMLALAAATAMAAAGVPQDGETAHQWRRAITVKPAARDAS